MHSTTLIPNSIPTTGNDNDYDIISNDNSLNYSLSSTTNSQDDNHDHDNKDVKLNSLDEFSHDDKVDKIAQTSLSERSSRLHHHDNEIVLDTDPNPGGVYDNNPPDSFWVSNNKVTDWLNHHTFIERKASVKLVAVSNKFDPTQTGRSSQRSISFNHVKPQTTIIGFKQKPGHHSSDGKSKQNEKQDNLKLFKNRSVQVKSTVLHVNEPKSPRVSCIGRVRSTRGRARGTGFWKNVKTAILNRVRANKVKKDR